MIAERVLITLLLALLAGAAYFLFTTARRQRVSVLWGHDGAAGGRPQLLYFRGDYCATCAAQNHHLERIAGQLPVTIKKIDVEREPETAARYGIFTLPTTVIIDDHGKVKHINYGLADAGKLSRQLRST